MHHLFILLSAFITYLKFQNKQCSQFSCEFSHRFHNPSVTFRNSAHSIHHHHRLHCGTGLNLCLFNPLGFHTPLLLLISSTCCVCFILHTVRVYKVEAGRSRGPVALWQAALTRTDQRRAKINRHSLI